MLSLSTIERYFEALRTRQGALAASLFTDDGAIDDFRGRHHAGREAIERFIGQVPALELEFLSDFIVQPLRATVYGNIHYPGQEPVLIRWIFTAQDGQIAHLCNSRIEQVPPDRRRS